MKSYVKKLLFSFLGLVFVGFFFMAIAFNSLVNDYIHKEAERALASEIVSVPIANLPAQPHSVRPPNEVPPFPATYVLAHSANRAFFAVNSIAISESGEILAPFLDQFSSTSHEARLTVEFLANEYLSNAAAFANGELVLLASENSTYYMSAQKFTATPGHSFTILLFVDVSPAMAFRDNMNHILRVMLIILGSLCCIVALYMSRRFLGAISLLCNYAQKIGQGNFASKIKKLPDSEFEHLSTSMTKMSAMLAAYDNSQKQFFQNVSHELRTPLMSIQGYIELMQRGIPDRHNALEIIRTESERMIGLVGDLLYISKLDSGVGAVENTGSVDIENLIFDCCERLRVVADESNVRVQMEPPSARVTILTDDKKLERVIANILQNAIRHAESNVHIVWHIGKGRLEIQITDDGPGIAVQDMPHIFERFYKGTGGLSGLGLAICKHLAHELGGSVTAENLPHPGRGARFTVVLGANS